MLAPMMKEAKGAGAEPGVGDRGMTRISSNADRRDTRMEQTEPHSLMRRNK